MAIVEFLFNWYSKVFYLIKADYIG